MKTCPKCGASNSDDAEFCSLCLERWEPLSGSAPQPMPLDAIVDSPDVDRMLDALRQSDPAPHDPLPESLRTELPSRAESIKGLASAALPKRAAVIVVAMLTLLFSFGHWWYPQLRRMPYRHLRIEVPNDAKRIDQTVDPVHLQAVFSTSQDPQAATAFFNRTMRSEKWKKHGWTGLMQDNGLGSGFTHINGEYSVRVTQDWLESVSRRRFGTARRTEQQHVLVEYWPASATATELESEHGPKAAEASRAGQAVIVITVQGSLTRLTDFVPAQNAGG